jgi:hypothetical protein
VEGPGDLAAASAPVLRRMAEIIGIFFSMDFNRLPSEACPSQTDCTPGENSVK